MTMADTNTSFMCDAKEAYTRCSSMLERPVFLRPVRKMILPGKVLKAAQPLYGMPEAGLH